MGEVILILPADLPIAAHRPRLQRRVVYTHSFSLIMKWDSEKVATRGVAVLIAYSAIAGVFRAASKPFWFDELITLVVARQPRVSGIWDALRHPVDAFPPPFFLVERLADRVIPNEHIGFRLPSIVAFCCVILCLFVFVRKRSGGSSALVCAALPLISTFYAYAVEARGYSLMTAFVAIGLVCYQRADSIRWTILLALSLAAAEAFHYYSVFALVPFGLAEVALLLETRRLRPAVWCAFFCGIVPLAVFWPLLSRVKEYFHGDFWAKPSLTIAMGVYGWFFNVPLPLGIAMAAVAGLGLVIVLVVTRSREREMYALTSPDAPLPECVLIWGLLALPFVLLVAMKVAHGGLTYRYMMPTVLGFPLAAGYMLPRLDRKWAWLIGVFVFFGLGTQEALFWRGQRHHLGEVISPAVGVEQLVSASGYPDLPVVVSDGLDYLQLVHYASPRLAGRLVSIVDAPAAAVYTRTDNVDKNLLALRPFLPLQVYEFQDFARKHPDFLLYSGGDRVWDWWPASLLNDGCSLRLVAIDQNDGAKVYLVQLKGDTGHQSATRATMR